MATMGDGDVTSGGRALKSLVDYEADAAQLDSLAFIPADPSQCRALKPADIDHFNQEGFVSPLPAFAGPEAASLRSYIDNLVEAVVSAPDRRNSYSISSYHIVCRGLYDLIQTPIVLDYVEDILGPDFVCWGMHLFAKQPGDPKEVALHQDAVYWPLTPAKTVSVWIAIDDVDQENAAMQFVPGSHLRGPMPHEMMELDGTRVLKRQVRGAEWTGDRFDNVLGAGEISIHSDLLLHGSEANRSTRRRAGLTVRYSAADVRPVPGWEHWISVAAHCRGSVPDYWPDCPRPEGEHPERMSTIWGDFDGTPRDAD
jgi:non-haem Fe2+, alpha-ketoglutarate-dependent halogenase